MNNCESLADDTRTIRGIWFPGENGGEFTVGSNVVKIVPYREMGQGGYTLWFEVWTEKGLEHRVNGAYVAGVKYDRD